MNHNGPTIDPIGVHDAGKHTLIVLVLDKSSSMSSRRDATIDGVNRFMREQKALPGLLEMTVTQFDTEWKTLGPLPADRFPPLSRENYQPDGCTALLAAVGTTIEHVGEILAARFPIDRPELVVFVVMTDGEENSSPPEWTRQRVAELVELQEKTYSWQFVFLGVGLQSFQQHATMNFGSGNSMQLDTAPIAVASAFFATSDNVGAYRKTGDAGKLQYTDKQRDNADPNASSNVK